MMFSIRNSGRSSGSPSTIFAAALLSLLLATGCQRVQNTPPEALNTTPLVIDRAMQLRNWEPSSVEYANGSVVAGPLGFWFEPRPDLPEWQHTFVDPAMFAGQALILPVTVFFPPPWTDFAYRGATVEPTYTAAPPLPPEEPTVSGLSPQPTPAPTPAPAAPTSQRR